jgi:hypothetical protein
VFSVDAVWTYLLHVTDGLPFPVVGPIVPGDRGSVSFAVSFGGVECLVSVGVVPGGGFSYGAFERRFVHCRRVSFGVARGFRVGVLPRYFSQPMLQTFSLAPFQDEALSFFYAADCLMGTKGSVIYRLGFMERLQPGSLQVDEEQGRIFFILRHHTSALDKLVILELV